MYTTDKLVEHKHFLCKQGLVFKQLNMCLHDSESLTCSQHAYNLSNIHTQSINQCQAMGGPWATYSSTMSTPCLRKLRIATTIYTVRGELQRFPLSALIILFHTFRSCVRSHNCRSPPVRRKASPSTKEVHSMRGLPKRRMYLVVAGCKVFGMKVAVRKRDS